MVIMVNPDSTISQDSAPSPPPRIRKAGFAGAVGP